MNPRNPRQLQPTPRPQTAQHNAAANIIRGQLNSIYDGNSSQNTPHTTPVATPRPQQTPPTTPTEQNTTATVTENAPQQSQPKHNLRTTLPVNENENAPTATSTTTSRGPQAIDDQWQQYHSAWQKYYQMYYERYYANHLSAQQALLSQQPNSTQDATPATKNEPLSQQQQQAIRDLRAKIRNKVTESTKKVRRSRHFMPALAGGLVMLAFVILQYNRVILGTVAAYTSPGNIEPQNIIVDPTISTSVGPEPKIIIPKINVDAPVVYGAAPDVNSQRVAMEKGVAHFAVAGASALPGQAGNTVLAGHSSNDAFAAGNYKFIFAQNEKLQKDDVIYLNYEGTRYTYKITSMEVVQPHEVAKIQTGNKKPMITLVSCVPVGTADKRLLVFAEQISPNPNTAKPADNTNSTGNIPGTPNPTVLERVFGAR